MQFIAQFNINDQIMPITMEQAGEDVYIRVDGLVIAHFVSDANEMTVFRPSATVKGLNLIVED